MTTLVKSGLDRPVTTPAELCAYLLGGARPRPSWGIGAEAEKLVVETASGQAARWSDVARLLALLQERTGWEPLCEGEAVLGLRGPHSAVTLEPGGQLELSGRFCPDLACCAADLAQHVRVATSAAATLGLSFLGLGVQPLSRLDQIDWLPKARYAVMREVMTRTGDMGQRMMKQTAGLQVNLDFSDEADCLAKLRLGQALAPVCYALFANSPLLDGRPSGWLSTRGEIWSRTDPLRTGLLLPLFAPGASLTTYVECALDVPMYFIVRAGSFLPLIDQPFPFRRFLAEGYQGERATLADWDLHLSTLFHEVRLRPQIELRSADALPPALTLAPAALAKGLLYDPESLARGWELFAGLAPEEWLTLYRRSWRDGLRTPCGKRTLREVARELLDLAAAGLRRQQRRTCHGLDESHFLEGARDIVDTGVTLAERLLAAWPSDPRRQRDLLLAHAGYPVTD